MSDDAARNHDTTRLSDGTPGPAGSTRRIFLKKMAYVPPTVLTIRGVVRLRAEDVLGDVSHDAEHSGGQESGDPLGEGGDEGAR